MSAAQDLELYEARRKVHVPIESPTVARGVPDYLRGVSDEMLERCSKGGVVPGITAAAALAEQLRRQQKPTRIQRKRSAGWRMPAEAVYVGRPTRWGNPFSLAEVAAEGLPTAAAIVVEQYREYLAANPALVAQAVAELRGKDLACWCKVGAPCHADVLLELANQ